MRVGHLGDDAGENHAFVTRELRVKGVVFESGILFRIISIIVSQYLAISFSSGMYAAS